MWRVLLSCVLLIACNRPSDVNDDCLSDVECKPGLVCRTIANYRRCQPTGDACIVCTRDPECSPGLFCVLFSDGLTRCGTGRGATSCAVR